jgi:hypothetical protein
MSTITVISTAYTRKMTQEHFKKMGLDMHTAKPIWSDTRKKIIGVTMTLRPFRKPQMLRKTQC